MATPKFAMKNVVGSWVETPLATPTKIEGNGSARGDVWLTNWRNNYSNYDRVHAQINK